MQEEHFQEQENQNNLDEEDVLVQAVAISSRLLAEMQEVQRQLQQQYQAVGMLLVRLQKQLRVRNPRRRESGMPNESEQSAVDLYLYHARDNANWEERPQYLADRRLWLLNMVYDIRQGAETRATWLWADQETWKHLRWFEAQEIRLRYNFNQVYGWEYCPRQVR